MDPSQKILAIRLAEATSIRQQLQKLGVLMDEDARLKLRLASNEYVKTGYSSTMRLRIDEKSRAIVHFRGKPGMQSGVLLEYF